MWLWHFQSTFWGIYHSLAFIVPILQMKRQSIEKSLVLADTIAKSSVAPELHLLAFKASGFSQAPLLIKTIISWLKHFMWMLHETLSTNSWSKFLCHSDISHCKLCFHSHESSFWLNWKIIICGTNAWVFTVVAWSPWRHFMEISIIFNIYCAPDTVRFF